MYLETQELSYSALSKPDRSSQGPPLPLEKVWVSLQSARGDRVHLFPLNECVLVVHHEIEDSITESSELSPLQPWLYPTPLPCIPFPSPQHWSLSVWLPKFMATIRCMSSNQELSEDNDQKVISHS